MDDIISLKKKIDSGELNTKEVFLDSVKKAHDSQEEYNPFVTILDDCEEVELTKLI